jgi:hypothetical protein
MMVADGARVRQHVADTTGDAGFVWESVNV